MSIKHKLRAAAALTAGAALAITPSLVNADLANAASGRKVLNVQAQMQQEEYWCWATAGLTVTQFLGGGRGATQNDFCKAGFNYRGSYCPNQPGQLYNVQRGARAFGIDAGSQRGTLSFDQVVQNINGGSPIPAGYYYSGGGGHMVTIVGYDADRRAVFVNDSYRTHPRQSWISHSYFTSNSMYRWAESISGMRGKNSKAVAIDHSQQGPASVETKPSEATVSSVDATAVKQVTSATDEAKSGVSSLLSSVGKSVAAKDVKVDRAPVQLLQLNPEFIAGRSSVVTAADSLATLAVTEQGSATVKYQQVDGKSVVVAALEGDEDIKYTKQAHGGTVFQEVQIGAWYRLADGKVTALNDVAGKIVGKGMSVADYQKIVHGKYADKMAGSMYQRLGYFGGVA